MTLLDVFEVEKEGEKEAFREDLPNRSESSFGFGKTFLSLTFSQLLDFWKMAENGFFVLMAYSCWRATEDNNNGFSLGCCYGMAPDLVTG